MGEILLHGSPHRGERVKNLETGAKTDYAHEIRSWAESLSTEATRNGATWGVGGLCRLWKR